MKFETKIVTLLMCVALSLLSSCNKKLPDTPVQEQQVPVGFRAMSQAVWVKSDETTTTSPMFPYDDFGVWGIARQGSNIYNLWGNDGLSKVEDLEHRVANNITNSTTQRVFTPTEAAYWLKDYDYNFLALAPYNPTGLSAVNFTLAGATGNTTGKDYMTFTYDMSSKYSGDPTANPAIEPDYAFDLLGAAAQSGPVEGGRTDSQSLMFWHLFSQIEIKNIGFATGINGTVTKVVFKAFPSGQYTISYDNSATNKTATTGVTCEAITKKADNTNAVKAELTFNNPNFSSISTRPLFNIIPQAVQNFELYIDFTIDEGTSTAPNPVEYQGFKIDLTSQQLTEYEYNGKYNWDITIGAKNAVSFNVVRINDWQTGTTPDEFPLQ